MATAVTACALPVAQPAPLADLSTASQGCARGPVRPEYRFAVPASLPPATQAVLRLAEAEWQTWGGQIVDFRAVDAVRTRAVRQLSGDDAAGPYPVLAVAGCWENDLRLFSRSRAYWQPLYGENAPTPRARERLEDIFRDSAMAVTAGRPANWSVPWSAVFISYVVTAASRGFPEAGRFVYGEAHDVYALATVTDAPPPQRYVPRPIAGFRPRPGDIACSYRGQAVRPAWEPGAADWRLGSAHCDIVMAVDTSGGEGRILGIGGNVLQAVSLSAHATDGNGRLVDGPFRNWAIILADRANANGAP